MKYMAVELSEERQKKKREELDAKLVLPSSTLDALPPSAVKIIKNFHFGSADCEDVSWTAASFGIVPRSGVRFKDEAPTGNHLQTKANDKLVGMILILSIASTYTTPKLP